MRPMTRNQPTGGLAPTQPRIRVSATKIQKNCLKSGRKRPERTFEVSSQGRMKSTRSEANMPITPASLAGMKRMSGTARRIA